MFLLSPKMGGDGVDDVTVYCATRQQADEFGIQSKKQYEIQENSQLGRPGRGQ